jgi:hypothetical protein
MAEKAPTRELLEMFDKWHVQVLGVKAVIHSGKDAKLIAGLWRSHGLGMVTDLMQDFFQSDDAFIRSNGYTVGMFVSQAGKLIARRQQAPGWTSRKGSRTGDSLEAAREFLSELAEIDVPVRGQRRLM